jgi:hypothetical protein
MIASQLFLGGKPFYINSKTRDDLMSFTTSIYQQLFLAHNMRIDETVNDWCFRVDGEEKRMYKFFPYWKRVLKDKLKRTSDLIA